MKESKKRLIGLLISGSIALTGVAGLSSCGETNATISPDADVRKNLTIETSLDAGLQIKNVVSFDLMLEGEKCYIKFFSHCDEGVKTIGFRIPDYKYLEHKDYVITYEISKDEYRTIAKFYNNTKNEIRFLTQDNVAVLQNIVNSYDPISVEENTIEVSNCEHSY